MLMFASKVGWSQTRLGVRIVVKVPNVWAVPSRRAPVCHFVELTVKIRPSRWASSAERMTLGSLASLWFAPSHKMPLLPLCLVSALPNAIVQRRRHHDSAVTYRCFLRFVIRLFYNVNTTPSRRAEEARRSPEQHLVGPRRLRREAREVRCELIVPRHSPVPDDELVARMRGRRAAGEHCGRRSW